MATPKYIRVNGKVYQRVEAAEMPSSQKQLYQQLIDRYFQMLEDVDFDSEVFLLERALPNLKRSAVALEKELAVQDNLVPKDWSILQSFVDIAAPYMDLRKLLDEASKVLDRRPQLAGYADQKGLNIPADYLE